MLWDVLSIINQNEIGVMFTNLAIINQQEQSHKKKNNLKTLVKSACSQASGLESLGYATETQGQSLPSPMASALSAEAYLKPPRTCGIFWRSVNKHVGKYIIIIIFFPLRFSWLYSRVFRFIDPPQIEGLAPRWPASAVGLWSRHSLRQTLQKCTGWWF